MIQPACLFIKPALESRQIVRRHRADSATHERCSAHALRRNVQEYPIGKQSALRHEPAALILNFAEALFVQLALIDRCLRRKLLHGLHQLLRRHHRLKTHKTVNQVLVDNLKSTQKR